MTERLLAMALEWHQYELRPYIQSLTVIWKANEIERLCASNKLRHRKRDSNLKRLLSRCTTRIDFYRCQELVSRSLSDFALLDKETVRRQQHRFILDFFIPWTTSIATTSGTTGQVLKVPISSNKQYRDGALLRWHQKVNNLHSRGFEGFSRPVHLRVLEDIGDEAERNINWRIGGKCAKVRIRRKHIDADLRYLINEYKNTYVIAGQPSLLGRMADSYEAQQSRFRKLKAVYSGGEWLDDKLRMKIEHAFDVPVFDFYSLTELGIIGMKCREMEGFHYLPWEWDIEVTGDESELVITSLTEELFPLLRYRTGDKGRVEHQRCKCGSDLPRVILEKGRIAQKRLDKNGVEYNPYIVALLSKELGTIEFTVVDNKTASFNFFYTGEANAMTMAATLAKKARDELGISLDIRVYKRQPEFRGGRKVSAFMQAETLVDSLILDNPDAIAEG